MANRIAGITVEIGGDTTKLSTALKTVNSEIRSTQSQLKDVNHLLKLDPGNTELLAQYTHTKHVYEGYKCCMNKGWDEVARICMTHSYVLMKDEFDYSPETVEEKEIKKFIVSLGEADLLLFRTLNDASFFTLNCAVSV